MFTLHVIKICIYESMWHTATLVSLILQEQIHLNWKKHMNSSEVEYGRKNNKTSDVQNCDISEGSWLIQRI